LLTIVISVIWAAAAIAASVASASPIC